MEEDKAMLRLLIDMLAYYKHQANTTIWVTAHAEGEAERLDVT